MINIKLDTSDTLEYIAEELDASNPKQYVIIHSHGFLETIVIPSKDFLPNYRLEIKYGSLEVQDIHDQTKENYNDCYITIFELP